MKKWNFGSLFHRGRKEPELVEDAFAAMARIILEAVGGKENVTFWDHCITRLRLEVRDGSLVDEKKIRSSGALGTIRLGKQSVQVVIGPNVLQVYEEFQNRMQ